MLSVRVFANLFETDTGRSLAIQTFDQVLAGVKAALANSGDAPNRNLTIAITTLYINFAVYLTSEGRAQTPEAAERGLMLLDELTQIVSGEKDSEAVYRGLVALGTLVQALGAEVKSAAKEIYEVDKVLSRVSTSGPGKEPRIKGVISEIRSTL
jgi:phospholipase A-2-activating protein